MRSPSVILIPFFLIACSSGADPSLSTSNVDGGSSTGNDGGDDIGGGGGTPTSGPPIGTKEGGFQLNGKDGPGTADALAGTHDVAIYRTPPDKTGWIGPAKLTLTRSGTELTAKLAVADGSVVQEVTNDMQNPRNYGQATVTPAIGMVLIDERGKQPFERIQFTALENGHLEGVAGGLGQVAFRNDILAYGPAIPSQLAALDGTWKGSAQAKLCPAPVEVTFAAGKVTTKGTPQPGCKGEQTVEAAWNGNDDYVVPSTTGQPQIFIDTANGGGSTPTGGTRIDLLADGTIRELTVFFQGFDGNVASDDLKKQ